MTQCTREITGRDLVLSAASAVSGCGRITS